MNISAMHMQHIEGYSQTFCCALHKALSLLLYIYLLPLDYHLIASEFYDTLFYQSIEENASTSDAQSLRDI